MERRHVNCTGNSSGRLLRNVSKKCYSLSTLQRENEKLRNDLTELQTVHDQKEARLTESLLKVEELDKQNHELRGLLKAAVVTNKDKVEMKDASTCKRIETKNVSTSVVLEDNETLEAEDYDLGVTIEAKSASTSSSVDDVDIVGVDVATCKTFVEIVDELPYDAKTGIIILDKILHDQKLSLNMKDNFQKIGGSNTSKAVNNILNSIATKNLLAQFTWDSTDSTNSIQNLKNILSCIYSAICSKDITQYHVNKIIKNAIKNARAKK